MIQTNAPLISIIVPVYEVEPYIRKCLDSIVNQTYKNLEIILIDDGSPDRCGAICEEYAKKDTRIIVVHQENQGLAVARNTGLALATGDYIQFIDSDDWIEKDACAVTLHLAIEHQADIVIFGREKLYPNGKTKVMRITPSGIVDKPEIMRRVIWSDGTNDAVWDKLFVKSIFNRIQFPNGQSYEDVGVTYLTVHQAKKIYATDQVFYHYLRRKGSCVNETYYKKVGIISRIFHWKNRLIFLMQNYPELADKQAAVILREMLIGMEVLKGDPDYSDFKSDYKSFVNSIHSRLKALTQYTRVVWLYYYCRPIQALYVKWLLNKQNDDKI